VSTSLLTDLTQRLGQGDTVRSLSQHLGISEQQTQTAVGAALPLLLSALGRNAESADGAQSLYNALNRDHDGSVLNDIAGFILNGGQPNAGQGILGHVLGNQRETVEQGIASIAGLNQQSVGQVLTLLAPLVLGSLGQAQQQQGLDASSLAGLLGNAREESNSQLGGLAGLLDMNKDGSIIDDVLKIGGQLLGGLFGNKR